MVIEAKAREIPSRCMITLLVQSVKLHLCQCNLEKRSKLISFLRRLSGGFRQYVFKESVADFQSAPKLPSHF